MAVTSSGIVYPGQRARASKVVFSSVTQSSWLVFLVILISKGKKRKFAWFELHARATMGSYDFTSSHYYGESSHNNHQLEGDNYGSKIQYPFDTVSFNSRRQDITRTRLQVRTTAEEQCHCSTPTSPVSA